MNNMATATIRTEMTPEEAEQFGRELIALAHRVQEAQKTQPGAHQYIAVPGEPKGVAAIRIRVGSTD